MAQFKHSPQLHLLLVTADRLADVAEALDYADGRGVIHRDIKPSNLLLATNGRLLISDFDLAKVARDRTRTGVETLTAALLMLGTARYMSPEQADEALGPIDRRTDVYALAATMYELLALSLRPKTRYERRSKNVAQGGRKT